MDLRFINMLFKNISMKSCFIGVVSVLTASGVSASESCQGYFINESAPLVTFIIGTDHIDAKSIQVAQTLAFQVEQLGARTQLLNANEAFLHLFKSGRFGQYFNTDQEFQDRFDKPIQESRGLVIVFPEYYGRESGAANHFLDYVQANLTDKPVSLVGVSEGQIGGYRGTENLKATIGHRNGIVYSNKTININHLSQKISAYEIKEPALADRIRQHFTGFLAFIQKLN